MLFMLEETVEKAKFFVTVAGDGQVFLWDFQSARDAVVRGKQSRMGGW